MPDGPDKTIWRTEQKGWFKEGVLTSDAPFKILFSPTPIIAHGEPPFHMDYPGPVPKEFDNGFPLFNLARDPSESSDLAAEHPEVVERLGKESP